MPKQKPNQKPKAEARITAVALKGTIAWRDWLNELATEARMPAPVLIDVLLADYAKAKGFRPPPER